MLSEASWLQSDREFAETNLTVFPGHFHSWSHKQAVIHKAPCIYVARFRNILSFIPALSKYPYGLLCYLRGSSFCICFWFHLKTEKKTILSDLHLKYSISCSSALYTYKRNKMLQRRYTVW